MVAGCLIARVFRERCPVRACVCTRFPNRIRAAISVRRGLQDDARRPRAAAELAVQH